MLPDPRQPRPQRRVDIERWINEAKPYLAAVAIDQVPSRQSAVIRGLCRLEVAVCDNLVLRYELDGAVRQRTDAVSYIAIRIEQEGIVRRRIGTAHLELDPRTAAPHWYASVLSSRKFLEVPNLDDAFALLLSADRSAREQYLAARRIAVEAVDEARLELAQPEDERSLEDLLTPSEGPLPVIGAAEDAPVSGMEPALDAPDTQGTDPDNGRELPKEIELPAIDFDQLSILDAAAGSAADTEEGRRRADQRLGLGPSGSFDHEAAYRLRRTIGRRGEQAVFEAERRRMMGLGRDPGVVVWRSRATVRAVRHREPGRRGPTDLHRSEVDDFG